MTPQQIEQVRDGFVHILFDPDRAAALFYNRLFAIAPETRAMFRGDMAEQGRRLIAALPRSSPDSPASTHCCPTCARWPSATSATGSAITTMTASAPR